MLRLDHDSCVPLCAQVEQLLRGLARRPEYRNGALLPDEVTLAAQLGVSRGTVRSGISKLVFEGVLERKAGVGTRLSGRPLESGVRAWRSFTREMAAKGIAVKNYELLYGRAKAGPQASQALQVEPGTPLWRLERVRGWDRRPVLQTTSWFHPRLGLRGGENFQHPVYETVERETGVRPHHAREEFVATVADTRTARRLRVSPGAPLLLRRHTVFDAGNRPFEYAEIRYVSSRFALTMDLRRGEP